ncbi:Beta-galactosidase [Melia azedarach]|uniref:Beta-galactosidase n=1 Tax=Melia azedarach TaxID=155640 RepID=A0ACC1XWE4_MELAZ|nr:Beta-galactosidase [Melia azedarach]
MKIPISGVLFLFFFIFSFVPFSDAAFNVTYTNRSLIIDGEPKLIFSASIHYPRSVPAYYFEGRFDLLKFIRIVQEAGMYMILRIGPYVAAEYKYGGVPVWLHYVPGSTFRDYDSPWMYHMQRFLTFIVKMLKREKLFASQGGMKYMNWAAKTAVSTNTGVPWIMCQAYNSPDPIIDTVNDFYGDWFAPHNPTMPKMWTENWPGWFTSFGGGIIQRPAEDVAFSVARFFASGGSVNNYYMYHGGTNFGRTSGLFTTTSYDYDAPIDEYGIPRNPKYGHLKEVHEAIKLCEHALLHYSKRTNTSLTPEEVHYRIVEYTDSSGACMAAFLANVDDKNDKTFVYRNQSYHVPSWSVSILPDCKTVIYNTAKVKTETSVFDMVPEKFQSSESSPDKDSKLNWEVYNEMVGIWGQANLVQNRLHEHLNVTKDASDYLWYTTRIHVSEDEEFFKTGKQPTLEIESEGGAQWIFVNDKLIEGEPTGDNRSYPISLKPGMNHIAILSMTVGLQSAGLYYEFKGAGPTSVKIKGFNWGTMDLSRSYWSYKIGLEGEDLGIYNPDCSENVNWISTTEPPINQSLTWYKVVVNEPPGDEPIGMDMLHMGKGHAWLNGEAIGRYWNKISYDNCVEECDYRGHFDQKKCVTNCGKPTQRWYHVPRSWFKPTGNVLVIFEEIGGDPTKITFSRRKVSGSCGVVGEHPHHVNGTEIAQKLHLKCPKNTHISNVKFASYGTPKGTCGSLRLGDCHATSSISVVEKVCLKKNKCSIDLQQQQHFDKDLCPGATKRLAVEVTCS